MGGGFTAASFYNKDEKVPDYICEYITLYFIDTM